LLAASRREIDAMMNMMQHCLDLMGGSMMGSNPMSWILPLVLVVFLLWVLSLTVLGALGVWAYRRLRTH
jgi:hypothetical protein